jgi:uncharacterized membrane protein
VCVAIVELRNWLKEKRWIHLVVILVAILAEVAVALGFLYSLILIVFALVLMEVGFHSK